ncbi:hypothetical protein MML48_9g00016695 [Holotrichia oblita]|uniref:Uncharacterized protein n=1 Tax=Holotrichia oblita TaxID=644536 RepID=A0ACB9SHH4_HOLOL|nr:hypothetical protein MML48_9g00016695 [Holotrichia oblita]
MSSSVPWQVVGATILGVIGAAGMLIIEHFRQERRRHVMSQDLARMSRQLSMMRLELDQLRATQTRDDRKGKKNKKRLNSIVSTTTTSTEDFRSALDLDSAEEEFYDLSDEEISVKTETILDEIDKNLDSGKVEVIKEALVIIGNMIDENSKRADLTWRAAKAYYNIAMNSTDMLDKQENIKKGIEMCETGLQINPKLSDIHKWYAILIGSRSDFQSMKDRISDGHVFKKHIDIAIELNPSDASLHHLLGRFAFEVAGLKWYERKAAAALFGEPPTATYQDALVHFLKAEDLSKKDWKENLMLIGKCFIANGDYKDAITWLTKAKNVTCKDDIVRILILMFSSINYECHCRRSN